MPFLRVASAAILVAVSLGGCGGTSSPQPSGAHSHVTGTPECPAAPYRPRVTSGDMERSALPPPARDDVSNGSFIHRLALDSDAFVADPPRSDDTARYSGDDAVCEVLASALSNNEPIGRQSVDTIAVGLARVSVNTAATQPGLAGGVEQSGTVDGVPDVSPKRPSAATYQDRLAWVVVVEDIEMSSCPAYGQGSQPTSRTERGHHGYAVFVVDAQTGGDALLYTERRNGACPGSQADGPWLDVPLTTVSLPWRLVSEQPDRSSAQISFAVSDCDGYSGVILDEETKRSPGAAVVVQRPFGPPCSQPRTITEKLRAGNVADHLPPHIKHAPTGPYVDV